jgi:hypothetical protein
MAVERKWDRIPPRAFALDGGANGSVFLSSTRNFKVKQKVVISATGLPNLSLEVKRVVSPTQLIVGPVSSKMTERQDLSEYLTSINSTIRAEEQDRSGIPTEQHERAVYAEEPIMAKRVISVDEYGDYYNEQNPMAIKLPESTTNFLNNISDGVDNIVPNPFSPPKDADSLYVDKSLPSSDTVYYKKNGDTIKSIRITYTTYDKNEILSVEIL